ncbi:hypothetical protein P167DRAFT_357836 [Morchella conica CCBAS932]|uniref:Uncharacterized protein n=1 Tax=Morchella conica CCBAS932 TaxID=1392247 RepID=A0A3N4KG16_9PEZI|nr:hypothetical protein P167DRAFT_357836 [Morchella conica CCBAS932]
MHIYISREEPRTTTSSLGPETWDLHPSPRTTGRECPLSMGRISTNHSQLECQRTSNLSQSGRKGNASHYKLKKALSFLIPTLNAKRYISLCQETIKYTNHNMIIAPTTCHCQYSELCNIHDVEKSNESDKRKPSNRVKPLLPLLLSRASLVIIIEIRTIITSNYSYARV